MAVVERITEYVDSRGLSLATEPGVVKGVKLLGRVSRNGREYTPEAITAAKPLYEGAKVNVNHAKGASTPRDYQDRFGTIRNVRETSGELFGDLQFNPEHSLAKQFSWDAQHSPESCGFSHNVDGRKVQRGGKEFVEAITKVHSVDLVADPAAANGIFEAEGNMDPNAQQPAGPGGVKQMILDGISRVLDGEGEPMDKAKKCAQIIKSLLKVQGDIDQALNGATGEPAAETEALRRQLGALREQFDALQAKDIIRERRDVVQAKIREAALPAALVTDVFTEQCLGAKDDAALARIIEDRQGIQSAAPPSAFGRPTSRDQDLARHSGEHLGGADKAADAGRKQGEDYVKQQLARRGLATAK